MALFNLNTPLAQQVYNDARANGAGFPLILKRDVEDTSTTADILTGRDHSTREETYNGFGVASKGVRKLGRSILPIDTAAVGIYGASLPPGVKPQVNDRVEIQGETYCIARIEVDPADAMYVCITE